ncbi:DUF1800 domain-containing protein [Lapillicoccus jejuensis]
MRRVAFGASGDVVDAVARRGPARWLTDALGADPATDPGSLATPPPSLPPVPLPSAHPSQDERRARNAAVRDQREALGRWWVRRMVTTGIPLAERVTFAWHHLFATDLRVVRDAGAVLRQNETQRRLGRGTVTAMTGAMLRDTALLSYLDGTARTAGTRNENLARELFEIFTLGRGTAYGEPDVHDASLALTGWRIGDGGVATYDPAWHEGGRLTVLGRTGRLGLDDVVDAALAHPTSAPHVVSRWWDLVGASTPVPAGVLRRAVAAYAPRREVGALLTALVLDPETVALPPSLVRGPVDWLVGSARSLGVRFDDEAAGTALGALRALGQEPFAPPNVAGWPGGAAWLSTAAAHTRLGAATWLAGLADLDDVAALDAASPTSRVEAVAHRLALPTLSDRTVVGLRSVRRDPVALVAAALVCPENLVV